MATVAYMGWDSIGNGELLRKATESGFDALITRDFAIEHEQKKTTIPISIVILVARTHKIEDIDPLIPNLLLTLQTLKPRTIMLVGV